MEGLKLIPYVFLVIAIAGIIGGAAAIVLAQFGETMTPCYNSSFSLNSGSNACVNNTALSSSATGKSGLNLTDEYFTKTVSVQGLTTISEQLPTVAIIAVMVIIISIIAGVFVYMRYFS